MKVNIKYFASLRELMGEASAEMDVKENTSVDELWRSVTSEKDIEFENVMIAVNMEYVKSDHALKAGDEIAFFPPVTGG